MTRWLLTLLRLLAAAVIGAALCSPSPDAGADVGGAVPAPGLCDYPSICTSGAAFGAYDYFEKWPPEGNGSSRVCLLGGAMYEAEAGFSMLVTVEIRVPIGVIRGACWYACPGPMLEQAEDDFPNPPAAWKNYLQPVQPTRCRARGPAPIPITPPPGPAPTPPAPGDAAAPPVPDVQGPDDRHGPAVTNPDSPNPDATNNRNSQ